MEKVLEINVAANSLWAIAVIKGQICSFYSWVGKGDLAYKTSGEAVSIAEESGDIFSKAIAYGSHGFSCYFKGFLKEAEEHLLKGADFAERINAFVLVASSNRVLGEVCFGRAEYQKAQEFWQKALSFAERASNRFQIRFFSVALAKAKVMSGEKDINLNEIFKCYQENRTKVFEGYMARYIGEILLNIDDRHMNEAEEWMKKAIEADKRNGTMFELGRAHASYAELLKRKGDMPGAKENLKKVIEIYRECGADGRLKEAEEALAEVGE